jgi:O-acetyl-ADP-ribose deacetylase (regulator of RNase III)
MKPEVARRRIESFAKRFGGAHLIFAYHAAFSLALTPDLLYRLWANFQRDIHGRVLGVPWIAVADLLLSSLCEEVGQELYEMDTSVRNILLSRLKKDANFGQQRINELSDFLLVYVRQQLNSSDPDMRDFAQAQRWTALAYVRPNEAARELAMEISKAYQQNKIEFLRIASLIENVGYSLVEFEPLLAYSNKLKKIICDESTKFDISKERGKLSTEEFATQNKSDNLINQQLFFIEESIGNSKVIITYCDITKLSVDVIVSSDDTDLSMGGGVSGTILKAGGNIIRQEARKIAPINIGDITITTAGKLASKNVFHAAVIDYYRNLKPNIDIIKGITKKSLKMCELLSYRSIAFPALATGAAGFSSEESAFAMITEIVSHLSTSHNHLIVTIALYVREDLSYSNNIISLVIKDFFKIFHSQKFRVI